VQALNATLGCLGIVGGEAAGQQLSSAIPQSFGVLRSRRSKYTQVPACPARLRSPEASHAEDWISAIATVHEVPL
jgi:hypothetical protein